MLAGIAMVVFFVGLGEELRIPLSKLQLSDNLTNSIIGIIQIVTALFSYILLFRWYKRRKITELSIASFKKYAWKGFFIGLVLQSLSVAVMYAAGNYTIVHVSGIASLLPGLITAAVAGFVAEIIIRGLLFRLVEEMAGTVITIVLFIILFFILHITGTNATFLSAITTALQAGLLLSAAYVYSRSLWFPIFLHFAWDFAGPGIYGGINPGITINSSLLTAKITGHALLTGGQSGPGNSIQSAIFCIITGLLLLSKREHFIKPCWRK